MGCKFETLKFMGFPWALALEQKQEPKWDLELENVTS